MSVAPSLPPLGNAPEKAGPRILFLDDEPSVVRMTASALRSSGFDVVALTSSAEALERFRSAPERFDLVITDHHMPELTGAALAAELHSIRPEVPILLCSGLPDARMQRDAQDLGIRELLAKPLELAVLLEAIVRALRAG